jgi:hypothetical protein
MKGTEMIDTDHLLASLTAVTDDIEGVYFDDDRYIDWSGGAPDGGRRLEVGDETGDAVQIVMSRADMVRLQRALTLHLLRHPE